MYDIREELLTLHCYKGSVVVTGIRNARPSSEKPEDVEERIPSTITRKIMTEETRFCENCCLCNFLKEHSDRKSIPLFIHLDHDKQCHKQAMKCKICVLEIPFNKLQEHLKTCASRTEWCWECNKYVMYKDQNKHKDICQNSGMSCHKDVNFQVSEASTNAKFIYSTGKQNSSDNLCVRCNKSFPDDQYSQHLQNKSSTAHKLTEVLAGQSTSKPSSDPPQPSTSLAPSSSSEKAIAWKDHCPKGKGRYHPLTSKTSPKPSKNKKMVGFPSPTRGRLSTSTQALKDTWSYDLLVNCAHCNVILPLPTLQKHEVRGDVLDSASYMLEQRATPAY
ncbi:XIAP-associated factor 1 [Aythya fuligula]|uniref:XIAP-associated factor 1 n=1 Tax=Aythya fuligula TaxID=219594 RepID=A0A6J3E4K9_AYTFU|nr:XIAP-associated factor 1 [Aythya fuligula]